MKSFCFMQLTQTKVFHFLIAITMLGSLTNKAVQGASNDFYIATTGYGTSKGLRHRDQATQLLKALSTARANAQRELAIKIGRIYIEINSELKNSQLVKDTLSIYFNQSVQMASTISTEWGYEADSSIFCRTKMVVKADSRDGVFSFIGKRSNIKKLNNVIDSIHTREEINTENACSLKGLFKRKAITINWQNATLQTTAFGASGDSKFSEKSAIENATNNGQNQIVDFIFGALIKAEGDKNVINIYSTGILYHPKVIDRSFHKMPDGSTIAAVTMESSLYDYWPIISQYYNRVKMKNQKNKYSQRKNMKTNAIKSYSGLIIDCRKLAPKPIPCLNGWKVVDNNSLIVLPNHIIFHRNLGKKHTILFHTDNNKLIEEVVGKQPFTAKPIKLLNYSTLVISDKERNNILSIKNIGYILKMKKYIFIY